jgi:hypothetical protein
MKKLIISLLALAAMSTASLATYRDISTPRGAVDTMQNSEAVTRDVFVIPDAADGNAGDPLDLGGSNRN